MKQDSTYLYNQINDIANQLKEEPENLDLMNDLGVGYFLAGEYSKSIDILKKAVHLKPDETRCLYNLANSLAELEMFEEAIKYYLDAIDQMPDHLPSLTNLASCYESIEQPEKAKQLFEYIIRLSPDNALSHFNYANFCLRNGDHKTAATIYRTVIDMEPTFTDAYFNLAWILSEIKAYEEAIYYAESGLAQDKDHDVLKELLSKIRNQAG